MTKLSVTPTQYKALIAIVSAQTTTQRLARRSGIIIDYADSGNAKKTARSHNTSRDAVYRWIGRWKESSELLNHWEREYAEGLLSDSKYLNYIREILTDAPRPGVPSIFTEKQKQKILAIASEKPEKQGVPVTHWTHTLLAQTVIEKGIVPTISTSKIGVFLKEGHIKTA